MTYKPLSELAEIYSGYAFREAIVPSLDGKTLVVQAKDVNSSGYLNDLNSLTKISADLPRSNAFVRAKDILLISRGNGTHRATVSQREEKNIVASSSLFIVRLKNSKLLPEYLALYLNSKDGQSKLSQITTGAYIQAIPRKNLEEITIPIPPLDKQKLIVELQENIWEQKLILERKSNIMAKIIYQATNKVTER